MTEAAAPISGAVIDAVREVLTSGGGFLLDQSATRTILATLLSLIDHQREEIGRLEQECQQKGEWWRDELARASEAHAELSREREARMAAEKNLDEARRTRDEAISLNADAFDLGEAHGREHAQLDADRKSVV
jgi:hypothetical protein